MSPVAGAPAGARRGQLVLAFAAVYLIWGSTYLAIRFAVETLPPFLMAALRFLAAGTAVCLWSRLRGAPAPTARQWRTALTIGAFMLLCGNGLVSWSEQYVSSGLTALLIATEPIWLVAVARLGPGRERPAGREVLGLLVGLAGVALLFSGGSGLERDHPLHALASIAIVVAAIAWAVGSIAGRTADLPAPALYASGVVMLAGGVLLGLAGLLLGELPRLQWRQVSLRSWLALAYLTAFGSVIAFSAYHWLLKQVRPALVATYAYVNPVVAVALGWWLGEELVSPRMGFGMAIILTGVVLVGTGRTRFPPRRSPRNPGGTAGGVEAPR